MTRSKMLMRAASALIVFLATAPVAAQQGAPTNLKVLPKDTPRDQVVELMGTFTRALGVRCIYCHVGEEGKPFKAGDFALDDKPTKEKARAMMRMTQDLNDKYLSALEHRSDPPVRVQCFTCHRGAPQPRMLQDVLQIAYDQGGLDSTVARYQSLRSRYYGRATYDFGEVPLADVAGKLGAGSHPEDAAKLLDLNVEMNPTSLFAKRQQTAGAMRAAFRNPSPDSGAAVYHRYRDRYGADLVNERLVNEIGYQLLLSGATAPAITAFKLNTAENPSSSNAWDSLGEAYATNQDWKHATEAYKKSLAIDPTNENATKQLEDIKAKSKAKGKKAK